MTVESKWIRTKSDEQAVKDGCTFQVEYAERVRTFLHRFCRQSIGEFAGKPLDLLPWQWDRLIAPMYSWRKPDGTRRFRQCGVWVPKNNGKSTLCSGLSLYHLIADNEPGAQVVSIAATVEQAGIVYRGAADMVAQSPELDKLLWTRKNIKTLEYEKTRSTYKVMSGERGGGKHGFSISALIFDELAEQTDRELWDTMRHNVGKRKNSLLVSISTSGFRRESIGYEQYQYASKIISGEIVDTSFLPLVFAARPEDDWTSIETFTKCNPSYGVTIDPREVQEAIQEAKNEPRKESAYKTLRLNLWCGAATTWLSHQAWTACGEPFDEAQFHGAEAWCGWDYGYKGDLASYCLVIPRDDVVYLLPRFFCPKAGAERKQRVDHVPYIHWSETPRYNLYLTDGDVIDPSFIRERLNQDAKDFRIVECGYDPTGLEESRQLCERDGLTMVSVPQRAKYLGGAASWFERAVLSRQLRHPNNPVLSWCLENTAVKETPDGLYPYKGSGDTQRIDGIVASLIGLSRYLARDQVSDVQFMVF